MFVRFADGYIQVKSAYKLWCRLDLVGSLFVSRLESLAVLERLRLYVKHNGAHEVYD